MAEKRAYSSCIETVIPVKDTLDVISGKWKLPIIISVSIGNERFTDIQDSIPGITPKILAKELKDLEQHQLIKRIVTAGYPVKISYQPDEYAASLNPIILAMKEWGLNHRNRIFKSGR